MNDFEAVARFTTELSNKWNKETVSVKNKHSFTGIQAELKVMKRFLENEHKEREAEFKRISSMRKYTNDHIQKKRRELDADFQASQDMVIDGVKKDIREMIADKYKSLDRMIADAPTPEQTALLQTLQMRGRNISRAELTKLMSFFYTNYQAMKCLEAVALAAGHRVHIPMGGDVMDLYGELDRAGEYLLRAADELKKPGKPDPVYRAFFFDNEGNPGNCDFTFQRFIDTFDKPVQLQNYTISTALSEAEQAMINTYFRSIDGLDPSNAADNITILRATDQIMKDHPDDVELMKRSAYAKYVREVEEINRLNAEQVEGIVNEQDEASAG